MEASGSSEPVPGYEPGLSDDFERTGPFGPLWSAKFSARAGGSDRTFPLFPRDRKPKPSDWVMVTMRCKCGAEVGQVGIPAKEGAGLVCVEYRCPACGNHAWWRSAPRHI